MGKVLVRFYEELNDYLPSGSRKRDFEVSIKEKETVRELVGTLGVPEAQVDLLLVNGRSVGFEEPLRDGDRISVYPVFEKLNIEGVSRVRQKPLRKLTFIVDRDLRPLAQPLRRLGLDVGFSEDFECEEVRRGDRRILLTLRGGVPGCSDPARVIVLSPGSLHEQVEQVIEVLDLRTEPPQESQHGRNRQRQGTSE
jgi:molybdopterin converting factor small subunit